MGWEDAPIVGGGWQDAPIVNDATPNNQFGLSDDGITPPRGEAGLQAPPPSRDVFGDTIEKVTRPSREAFGAFTGGLADQSKSPTYNALPAGTPNIVKRPLAAVGDLGGAALSGLGVGYAGAAGLVGEVFGGSPTNEMRLAGDLISMGEVAVPELTGVSSTARLAGKVAATKSLAPKTPAQIGARAADDLGITPSLGMVGKGPAMTAAGLEKVPFTGGIIAKDATRAVGEIESAFQRIAGNIGVSANPEFAGRKLQAGLVRFVDAGRKKSDDLYGVVERYIPEGTQIRTTETMAAIQDALEPFKGNPEIAKQLGLNKWAALAGDMEQGMSWRAVMDLRSSVGESIGKARGALADMDQGKLNMVYANLTNDLESAASAAGPDAFNAWTRANIYYRGFAKRVENSLDHTISAKSPERAFEAFANMASADRASSDITRMRKIRASLSRDDWNDVSSSIVERMGKATAGQQSAAGDVFSPSTFLTQWNKMDDEAKRILLPEQVRVELGKLASVAEQVRAGNVERNMSNTASAMNASGAFVGAFTIPKTTIAALGAANLSARFLTSTASLRALNRHLRGDSKALKAMASGRGPFALDATTILRMSAADAASGGSAANRLPQPVAIAN